MAAPTIITDTSSSGITTITLNRPRSLNALNAALLHDLTDALKQAQDARVIVLKGAGNKAFCAGQDLKESLTSDTSKKNSGNELFEALNRLQDITRLLSGSSVLIIAAVQGYAVGGGAEIALAADFIIGSPTTLFKFPEVVIGHAATGGITQRLPQLIGLLKAKELLLTGRPVGAEEALRIGLLSEVVDDPVSRAQELAQKLAALPQTSAASSKTSLESAVFPTREIVLKEEVEAAARCMTHQDASKAFSNFASRKGSSPGALPGPERSLASALANAAQDSPTLPFLRFGGKDTSYGEFDDLVAQMAGALQALGVGKGDRVLVMMRNSVEMVCSWFATNRIGAVWAPINPELRSSTLKSVVESADPKVMLADPELLDLLRDINTSRVQAAFPCSAVLRSDYPVSEALPCQSSDTSALLFTSGTSGKSKPCILSHGYFVRNGNTLIKYLGLNRTDVLYCPFPLFHIDATALTVVPALLMRAVAALSVRYSASKFWNEIRATRATVYDFMGATLALSYKKEPLPTDRDHSVRLAWGVPVPSWASDYEKRFGHAVVELYGSCEVGIPVVQQGPRVPGSCGRVVEGYLIQLVDHAGKAVPTWTAGELLVRADHPDNMFHGYFGNEVATNATITGPWVHTGDHAKVDEDGNLFYIGRAKDVVRRRGENINAFEVEEEILAHPDVFSVAALGVPSGLGQGTEDDLKVAVVPKDGAVQYRSFSEEGLWSWTKQRMARFQVPDIIEFVDKIERTSTGKVAKWRLKKAGGVKFSRRPESKL
ncbi:acetyl-CoA synthetase-like protein [Sarocladium strictum]